MAHSIVKHPFLRSYSRFVLLTGLLLIFTGTSSALVANYRIGATGGDYTTIAAAYANTASGAPGDTYYIEILPNYVSEATTSSIILGPNNGTTVIIRPFAGNTNFTISTTIAAPLFTINGATNVTIDGRPGGTGTTGLMTLQNTSTNGGMVVQFLAASTNNVLQYCIVKGSNTNTASTSAGVISFKAAGANANTIDRCTIQAAGTNKPAVAIVSRLNDIGAGDNSNNTISNCNIVDFTSKAIWIANPSPVGWRILNNSFYQSAAFTATTAVEMIFIGNGSGYIISGNYFGGKAPNCGGTAYTITSGTYTPFRAIYFSNSNGTNTITSNTIQNISFGAANYSGIYGFTGIYLRGLGSFTIGGGAATGNTIGSLTTAGSITFSNNATGGTAGFCAIQDSSASTTTPNLISYNNIGGIQLNTSTTHASDIIKISNGTAGINHTIEFNTIGSATAPITSTLDGNLAIINSNANVPLFINDNSIQRIALSNTSGSNLLYVIRSAGNGNASIADNIISNISSAANAAVSIINYSVAGTAFTGTIKSNTIHTIALSNTGNNSTLNVLTTNASAPVTIDGNTIGNTSANNITLAGNSFCNVITGGGAGDLTASNNTIQNITLSSAGTAAAFIGIGQSGYYDFNCTGNTITDITNATGNTAAYGCIYSTTINTGVLISNNIIRNIAYTGTGTTVNSAISLGGASGYGGTVSKNMITGLSNASALGRVSGIELTAGNWTIVNNVILLDNASGNTATQIAGINLPASGGTNAVYHNTIKLYGTQTGALGSSAISATGTAGTYTIRNNIFQNLRSGGTGSYYAENYANGPTVTTNNNYLESSTTAAIARKGGTSYAFAAWQSAAPAAASVTGTATIDAAGKVTSAPFAGASAGSSPAPVPDDFTGAARNTVPWIGAYEGLQILTSPISPSTLCAGANTIVSYVLNGSVNGGNVFTAQLSDATGSFATPVNIGTSTSTTGMGVIIPAGIITTGTAYRIRVVSSNPAVIGVPNNAALTINPMPTITPAADFAVCASAASSPVSATAGGSATGVTWTTNGTGTYSNANIVNPVYTFTAAEKTAGSVKLTATTTGGGCGTAAGSLTITFTSVPAITTVSPAPAICSGNSTNITLTSTPAGATVYSWTRATVAGITQAGTSGGTGTISETLTNSTTAAVNVTYAVSATLNGCTGTKNIVQTVNVPPTITAPADFSVCANVTASNVTAALTNASGIVWSTSGTGSFSPGTTSPSPDYSFTTADRTAGSVTLTATASGIGSCPSASDAVTITIKPLPVITTAVPPAICSGTSTSVSLTATPTGTATYTWSRAAVTGITPATASGTSATIAEILTNATASPVTTSYTVTPTVNGCTGSPTVINQTVNPAPTVNVGADKTVCANQTASVTAVIGNATGVIWSSSGTGSFSSTTTTTTSYTFSTLDKTNGSVTLTASTTGNGGCVAATDPILITISAAPTVNAGLDQTICASTGTAAIAATITGATGVNWTGGTGSFTAPASASTSYTFSTADITAGNVTLTATTSGNGICAAATDNVIITITAPPTMNTSDITVCSNQTTVAVTSAITNHSSIAWTTTTGTGTITSGSTANPTYTLSAADIAAGSVTLKATVNGNSPCSTPINKNVVITIKTAPVVNAVAAQTICSGTNTSISLSSTPAGAAFTWTVSSAANGASAGSGNTINQPLTGNGTFNYLVTPVGNGCTGNVFSIPVTVNTPVISPAALPPAIQNTSYTQNFTVTNMTSPVWTFAGTGPTGFTLSSAGVFNGTSATTAQQIFTVRATSGACIITQVCTLNVSTKPPTTWNGTTWDNGAPDATTDAIINGTYKTTTSETFVANNITVNSGATLDITGTATVTVSGSLNNNGTVKQICTATINGTQTGTAVVVQQPVLTPANALPAGKINSQYVQGSPLVPFTLSFGTNPTFTSTTLPPGLSIVGNKITGFPTVAGTYSVNITASENNCIVTNTLTLTILDLANPQIKFPQPSVTKTYGDAAFYVKAKSQSGAAITYSISPANICANVAPDGLVTINCVPTNDIWVFASQGSTSFYRASKDSVRIIVNKATPQVTFLSLPGIVKGGSMLFEYQLPADYIADGGSASYIQTRGQQFAFILNDTIKAVIAGDSVGIEVSLAKTINFSAAVTTFYFNVYDEPVPPTAVADTVVLIRKDGVIADGSVNLLKNDRGTTGHLRVNLTDIDIINPGNQSIYYAPSIGTFDLDPNTGILTVHPTKGLTGTARIGYTITDSNNVTSDVAYVTLRIEDTQDLPDMKANEVMTPNSDGKNDALFIGYTDINLNNRLQVVDQAGNIVYETANYRNDWLGTDNKGNELEPGVYYYTFNEEEGLNRVLKNYVTIVR